MQNKSNKKFQPTENSIYRSIIGVVVCLGLTGCGDPYTGFGCIAPEAHPAVGYARSLSAEQLKNAYIELQKLSSKHAMKNYGTQISKVEIPSNLQFLRAELIRVDRSRGPYVILANCYDERIELSLSPSSSSQAIISLHWAETSKENGYGRGTQILWQEDKEN